MNTTCAPIPFGPYELLEPLGGGMGIVYRARRVEGGEEVAVKLLRHERLLDGGARARFARELRTMQRLRHPRICPVLEAGEVDGMPYFSMPLLRGRSLAAQLELARRDGAGHRLRLRTENEAATWQEVLGFVAMAAEALAAAHAEGFVHRDIKPANLWIDERGEALLLDFGLARDPADRLRHLTRTGQVVGTPAYLAPEQLDPRLGSVGPRADVYGLGAVLFEALTLRQPFTGRSRAELFANIIAGGCVDPRRLRPDVPIAVADFLAVAMARRQRHRYPDAASMAADLRRLIAGQPLRARLPSLPHRLAEQARCRPLAAGLAACAAVSIALGIMAAARLVEASQVESSGQQERLERMWFGRAKLAEASYLRLPPGWPRHRAALTDWLRACGRPLLQVPPIADPAYAQVCEFAARAVADVEQRLAFAGVLEQRRDAEDAAAWRRAADEVAADPRFAGFDLCAQPGLLPLGCDPASGLQEFLDLASCAPDVSVTRDAQGRLQLLPVHGIVFVLLPPGRQPEGAGPRAPSPPFLMAKHELTRAQYARLSGGVDPSTKALGFVWDGERQTEQHPVDNLYHADLRLVLARFGLCVPTLAEWRLAAAAGGEQSASWTAGNFDDAAAPRPDGFRHAAPVGSFLPNAYGLHDMQGNLIELCVAEAEEEVGGGEVEPTLLLCGGGYGSRPWRIDEVSTAIPGQRHSGVGVRPVRRLTP